MDDENPTFAREQFMEAIRTMVTSTSGLQQRLIDAYAAISVVKIDDFGDDAESKIKFARILDIFAPDVDEESDEDVEQIAAGMSDIDAIRAAHLTCDLFYDLG